MPGSNYSNRARIAQSCKLVCVSTSDRGNNNWLVLNHYIAQKKKKQAVCCKTRIIADDRANALKSQSLCRQTTACEAKGGEGGEDITADSWGSVASGQGQTLRHFDEEMRTCDKNMLWASVCVQSPEGLQKCTARQPCHPSTVWWNICNRVSTKL